MSKHKLLKSVISLTDAAADQIKKIITQNNDPNIIGVRLGTKMRGCNGTSYVMEYIKKKELLDEHVQDKGVNVFVDNKALLSLIGTEMDFVEGTIKSEFVFNNPNAKGTCGCGESFHTQLF